MERVENSLNESERKQLLEEAEEAFQERLEAFKAEKADLESKATVLNDQLEKAQRLLKAERQRVVSADQFTVSDAGMAEIETRLARWMPTPSHPATHRRGPQDMGSRRSGAPVAEPSPQAGAPGPLVTGDQLGFPFFGGRLNGPA